MAAETSSSGMALGAMGNSGRSLLSTAVHRHNRFQLPAQGSWLNVTQVQKPFIVVQYRVESHYFQLEIDLRHASFLRTDRGDSSTPSVSVRSSTASTPPAVQPEIRPAEHQNNPAQLPARSSWLQVTQMRKPFVVIHAGSWLQVTEVREPFIVVKYSVESQDFVLKFDLHQARFLRTERAVSSTPRARVSWGSAWTPRAVQPESRYRSRSPRATGRSEPL